MTTLITGANRGIGARLATDIAAAGTPVIGTSRRGAGPDLAGVRWQQLDVTDPAEFAALAQALGGVAIDLLICNAGTYLDRNETPEHGYPPAMWAQEFATNVTGVFLTVQALLANLRASDAPKIAIISSQMGSQASAAGGSYIYRASKAAVLNLGRNLAVDLKPDGIAVGIYHPGWVQTDMGGRHAQITTSQSSAGLRARFAALNLDSTGCFETWDGRPRSF